MERLQGCRCYRTSTPGIVSAAIAAQVFCVRRPSKFPQIKVRIAAIATIDAVHLEAGLQRQDEFERSRRSYVDLGYFRARKQVVRGTVENRQRFDGLCQTNVAEPCPR